MSARSYFVITCDVRGCTAAFTSASPKASTTRINAALERWTYGVLPRLHSQGPAKSIDMCPEHDGAIKGVELVDLSRYTVAEKPGKA